MMRGIGFEAKGASPPATSTWDPANSGANLAYSNGNLTATKTTNFVPAAARSTTAKTTGKWYGEITVPVSGGGNSVGICRSTFSQTGNQMGDGTPSVGIICTGNGSNDGVAWVTGSTDLRWGNGGVIFVAVDAASGLVWFKVSGGAHWNDNPAADPAAGVGGQVLSGVGGIYLAAAVAAFNVSEDVTVNFGATAFVGAPPAGFTAWG